MFHIGISIPFTSKKNNKKKQFIYLNELFSKVKTRCAKTVRINIIYHTNKSTIENKNNKNLLNIVS